MQKFRLPSKKKLWRSRRAFNLSKGIFRRGISILPHLFTFGNAFFGFASLLAASSQQWEASAYCILLGALMDGLDGRVARLVGVESELGVQLDSLADAVTFCLAPAFLVYAQFLHEYSLFGLGVSVLFFLAGLLRLARFNIIHQQQTIYFLGLPTTIAGLTLASILLNCHHISDISVVLCVLVLLFSWLMVSKLPFPAGKNVSYLRVKKRWVIAAASIMFAIVATFGISVMLLSIFSLYFFSALILVGTRACYKRR